MTTENTEPTGNEQAPPEQQQEAPKAELDPAIAAALDERFGRLQGQMAGVMGQRTADFKREITDAASAAMRELQAEQQRQQAEQQAYLQRLASAGLDEEQLNAVMQANAEREKAPEPKQQDQQQPSREFNDGYSWSASERQGLGRSITALLDGMSVTDVEVTDQRLWQGVTPGMTTDQAYAQVRNNARAISKPEARSTEQRTTTQPKSDEKAPPPSTQAAPAANAASYDSKAEAAAAFAKGEIDIIAYKEALASL